MSDTTQDLVQQGLTASRVGDADDALRLLRQATESRPHNAEAWLALAGVVETLEEKEECFKKVLSLDPANEEARAGLTLVEKKLADRNSDLGLVVDEHREQIEEDLAIDKLATVCYRHPQIETGLRCNRCNKAICAKCAVRTPVGFRCPDCIRAQENKYYSGGNMDYVIAAVIAFPLSLIIAGLFTTILSGFGFFILIIAFFVAPLVTGIIAEAVRWGVRKRRSRYLRQVVVGCFVLATLPFLIISFLGSGIYGLIAPAMLLFLGITTISARLR